MSPRANVLADTGLRAGISLSLEEFKNFMRGVALLSGKLLILYQQFFNTELVWPKNNGGGTGYTPVTTPPPYLYMIDVTVTNNPTVSGNTSCLNGSPVTSSATSSANSHAAKHHEVQF